MCGIVGYVGKKEACPFLLTGLRRLEYRGYDSAGIATLTSNGFQLHRAVGRIDRLEEAIDRRPMSGSTGIGHTRWATHGAATTENAHPHMGGRGQVAVVHNGVIENYESLKQTLIEQGYNFSSATDSEVVAHLIAESLKRLSRKAPMVNRTPPSTSKRYAKFSRCCAVLMGSLFYFVMNLV